MIILGDGGYRSMGYITLTKIAHQLLTLTFHLNVLIGHQKVIMNLTFILNDLIGHHSLKPHYFLLVTNQNIQMKCQGQQLMSHLGQCYITHTAVTTITKYDL